MWEAALQDRLAWITAYERSRDAGAVCRHYGITRATLRKWWRRYEAEGMAGLAERSRAPVTSPNRKAFPAQVQAVLALRAEGLGGTAIRARLLREQGVDLSIPTIRRILARAGEAPAPAITAAPEKPSLLDSPPEGLSAQLLEAITRGQLRPGEKLAEEALARRLGAGRTRVREALRNLAFLGLVRIERNRGAFVAMPSGEEIAQAYEARRVVECGIVAGLPALTPAQIATLRQHVKIQAAAEAAGQRLRLVRLLTEFHLVLAGMGANAYLRGFLQKLVATTSHAVLLYDHAPRPCCAVREHGDIVEHLARGETDQAVALMTRHLGANQSRVDHGGG
ncbi:FCD domain-containing protein [Roseomonas sp. GC11]|uniref:FCD domain-containing protein n=1 Tax=Roseomonas sp. GC11 TaxID=2950546 RepID=UPI002108B4F8|nr:FCD domain-containing protein [Roseomonas sp. GC11]MCQ4162533.1 FCD domain-containing protein [Roseomonas sp. GC11]